MLSENRARGAWVALTLATFVSACGSQAEPSKNDGGLGGADPGSQVLVVKCDNDNDCNDGNSCNGRETCDHGSCQDGKKVDCDDDIECTVDSCNPDSGECSHKVADRDGDGHVSADCKDKDGNSIAGDLKSGDCDDNDPDRFPGNVEVCTPTDFDKDDDCDPKTFGNLDKDGDRFVDSICVNFDEDGKEYRGRDCNDQLPNISPENTEACDGVDNDCDGDIDEGVLIAGYRDQDGDGVGVPVTEDELQTGDIIDKEGRLLVCPGGTPVVQVEVDCDDSDPLKHKNMIELCDLVDNDCDGDIDENVVAAPWYIDADGDGFGNPAGPIRVSCELQIGYSLIPSDCDDADPLVNPNQKELCDGIDNDCDGTANFVIGPGNYEDDDKDGYPDLFCASGIPDCDDNDKHTHPGAVELCDNKDNDCNGLPETRAQDAIWYVDSDGDGFGNPLADTIKSCEVIAGRVTVAGDCDDRDPNRNPDQPDDCTGIAGFDDDCDGVADEDEVSVAYFRDQDGDGYGASSGEPLLACLEPAGWSKLAGDCNDLEGNISPDEDEDCTLGQGIDDDCDGLIDCADPECSSTEDCQGLYVLALESPSKPVAAVLASPFTAKVSLKSGGGSGSGIGGYDLAVTCKDGAATTTPTVQTAASDGAGLLTGEANITLYPGLSVGNYECQVSATGSNAIPLKISIQSLAPQRDTVHTVFNVKTTQGFASSGEASLVSAMYYPAAIAVRADGTFYVADNGEGEIYAVSPRGKVEKLLGDHQITWNLIGNIYRLAVDSDQNILFIAAEGNGGQVVRYDLDAHTVTTWVGGGTTAYYDGMPATEANIDYPYALSHRPGMGLALIDRSEYVYKVTEQGTLYRQPRSGCGGQYAGFSYCDQNRCSVALTDGGALLSVAGWCAPGGNSAALGLGRLEPTAGIQTLLSTTGSAGGNLPLSQTTLGTTTDVELDKAGNALVVDDHRVRFIHRREQIAYDLIGGAVAASTPAEYGDYGPAKSAMLNTPVDAAVGPDGSVYIVSSADRRIRRIWRPTIDSTVQSVSLNLTSSEPSAIAGYRADPVQFVIEDQNQNPLPGVPVSFENTASYFTHQGPTYSTVAGLVSANLISSMVPGTYEYFAIAEDLHGNVMATTPFDVTVNRPADGVITTILNQAKGSGTLSNSTWAPEQLVSGTYAVAAASDGTVYASVFSGSYRVYSLTTDGRVTRVAGGGSLTPDGVGATAAALTDVRSIRVDEASERLYLVQSAAILLVDLPTGLIYTLAAATDGKSAALSADGNDYYWIGDAGIGHLDLRVSPPTNTTLLSTHPNSTASNCNGNVGRPFFDSYGAMALGDDGLLYIAAPRCTSSGGALGYFLFTVDPSDATVSELATLSDGGIGDAEFDAQGNLYVAVSNAHRVFRWNGSVLENVTGTGAFGSSGDLGPATAAALYLPRGVAFAPEGALLITDVNNHAIRKVWFPQGN